MDGLAGEAGNKDHKAKMRGDAAQVCADGFYRRNSRKSELGAFWFCPRHLLGKPDVILQ